MHKLILFWVCNEYKNNNFTLPNIVFINSYLTAIIVITLISNNHLYYIIWLLSYLWFSSIIENNTGKFVSLHGCYFKFYFNCSATRLRCRVGGLPPPKRTLEFIVPLGAALDGNNFTRKTCLLRLKINRSRMVLGKKFK